MDPKLKTKWVRALRSGKFRQAKGQLRRAEDRAGNAFGYCCLGVLCEIAPGVEFREDDFDRDGAYAYAGEVPLGLGTFEYAGLKHFGIPRPVMDRLVELNDGETRKGEIPQRDFNEIADWIEKSKRL